MIVRGGLINLKIEIFDVAYGGEGVGRHEGKVCFVPGALPGETVACLPETEYKRFTRCKLQQVITPSPARIEPQCPIAANCPGCAYQHVGYDAELQIKKNQLRALMQRLGHIDIEDILVYDSKNNLGYRNKITLHAAISETKRSLGYVGNDNQTVLDVGRCPLAMNAINEDLAAYRSSADFYAMNNKDRVTFRYTNTNGACHWRNKSLGIEILTESTTLGNLQVPAQSFFQVNPPVANILIEAVTTIIKNDSFDTLMDFYCGVGVFSIAAGKCGVPSTLGVDSDRKAIEAAKQNARDYGLNGAAFLTQISENIAADALEPARSSQALVIVDPPRRGLNRQMINALCKTPPKKLIYISCAADTLARDLALLAD
ncbi:MAG: class I SAM-dependent RNA methyltransferase, partial [Lentisphaerae bacterium]|nr:class I SAM-dependent RNA methyltransferase [Lentisphaerota bacterium]